jgi:hypothetical protein
MKIARVTIHTAGPLLIDSKEKTDLSSVWKVTAARPFESSFEAAVSTESVTHTPLSI